MSVVEFGAGPGRDGVAFAAAGIAYLGVDLAHGNGVLPAEAGMAVLQASLTAVPVRKRAFSAGWSMSTLMHFPADQVPIVMSEIAATLEVGSPVWVGMWGSDDETVIDDLDEASNRRTFWLRPLATNRALLEPVVRVERVRRWPIGRDRWYYQVFECRVR